MGWHEDAEGLMRLGRGWMAPNGGLISCGLHRHLEALGGVPAFADTVQRLLGEGAALKVTSRPTKHGAWDDWCISCGDFLDQVHAAGWIRLTVDGRGADRRLGAEGTRESLLALGDRLEDLAAALGACLRLRTLDLAPVPQTAPAPR